LIKNTRFWDFDDYVQNDIPTAVNYVLKQSNTTQLHYIGHSMGGMLLLSYLSTSKDHLAQFRSGITVGSSLMSKGAHSGFDKLIPLLKLIPYVPKWFVIPNGSFNTLLSPFITFISGPLESFQMYAPNMDPAVTRMIFKYGFHSIPLKLLVHLSSAIIGDSGMTNRAGTSYLHQLANLVKSEPGSPPVLLIAGDKDEQCPPKAAENTYDVLSPHWSHGKLKLNCYGKTFGHREGYGHHDLLIGKRAVDEVFPDIVNWISTNDSE